MQVTKNWAKFLFLTPKRKKGLTLRTAEQIGGIFYLYDNNPINP